MLQVLGVSIWTYQGPGSAKAAKDRVKAASEQFQPSGRIWLPILALYTPVHLFAFVVVSSFLLLPVRFAAAFWVGSLVVYYALTSQGNPQHTGEHPIHVPSPLILQEDYCDEYWEYQLCVTCESCASCRLYAQPALSHLYSLSC